MGNPTIHRPAVEYTIRGRPSLGASACGATWASPPCSAQEVQWYTIFLVPLEEDAVRQWHAPSLYPSSARELEDRAICAAVSALADSFRCGDPAQMDAEEQRALDAVGPDICLLAQIAKSDEYRIDVRGLAARLFIENLPPADSWEEVLPLVMELEKAEDPIIRLGVVLGHAKLRRTQRLRRFVSDPDDEVRQAAKEACQES